MCWPRPFFAWLCACVLLAVPAPAQALEISGGVSLGGILIGTDPRLAVSPHAGMSWALASGFAFSVHEHLNILLPAVNKLGVGVYNQTSIAIGYVWKTGNLSIGPSLSIYSMPACTVTLCGRVAGAGLGGHAQITAYLAGPLGASVSANLDWLGGISPLLLGSVAAMVIAGPVLRWSPR